MHQWDDLQDRDFSFLSAYFAEDPGRVPKGVGKGFLRAWPAKDQFRISMQTPVENPLMTIKKLQPAVSGWRGEKGDGQVGMGPGTGKFHIPGSECLGQGGPFSAEGQPFSPLF